MEGYLNAAHIPCVLSIIASDDQSEACYPDEYLSYYIIPSSVSLLLLLY